MAPAPRTTEPPWFCITRRQSSHKMGSFWLSRDVFSVKRVKNRGNKDLGVIAQHRNSEAENSPAVGHECVLPPAVRLEKIVSCSRPSISIANFCDLTGSNRDPFSGSGLPAY